MNVRPIDMLGFDGQVQQSRHHFLGIGLVFGRCSPAQFFFSCLDLRLQVTMVELGERHRLLGQDGQASG